MKLKMEKKVENFVNKINKIHDKNKLDLSVGEDLSIALMNLVSLEEHLYFTAMKTNKQKYLDMLNQARGMRIGLMKKLVVKPEGEEWCISKHLLAASMRLIETGNKHLKENKKDDAWNLFENAFELYGMFWALNLGKIDNSKLDLKGLEQFDSEKYGETKKFEFKSKFSEIIKKIINCCRE